MWCFGIFHLLQPLSSCSNLALLHSLQTRLSGDEWTPTPLPPQSWKKRVLKKRGKKKQRAGIKVRVCGWVGGGMFWMQSVCAWPPLARVSIAALAARQAY